MGMGSNEAHMEIIAMHIGFGQTAKRKYEDLAIH
jgi:hypothetical protein